MKDLSPPVLQESVRNQLETSGEGIVSYIPSKFASQNPAINAFCQKLPTAYFSFRLKFMIRFEEWRNFAPVVHFCTRQLQSLINSTTYLTRFYTNLSRKYSPLFHSETIGGQVE